jgi:hypothetical protein
MLPPLVLHEWRDSTWPEPKDVFQFLLIYITPLSAVK